MYDAGYDVRKRPFGVTAIAVIQVVAAAVAMYQWWSRDPFEAGLLDTSVYLHSLTFALASLTLIAAVGLLLMHKWAWPAVLLAISVNMAVGLWAYYDDHPNYIMMTLNVIAIFYLNSRDVRLAFDRVRPRDSVPIE